MLESTSWSLHFWRTKDGAEVDFVLNRGKDIVPVEVKFSDLKEPKITRSLHSFINTYHPDIAYLVNLSLSAEINVHSTKVIFLPYSDLFSDKFITGILK